MQRSGAYLLALLLICTFPATAGLRDEGLHPTLQILQHDQTERSFLVRAQHLPANTPQKVALVIVLHGGGGNAEITERMTGFTKKAMQEGFIVVYPNGSSRLKNKLQTWNAVNCCGYAMEKKVDDVGFIRKLIDHMVDHYPVDPAHVYVTGLSNGGMMAHQVGMHLPDKITAIAPVIAGLFGDEPQALGPVSALMINGKDDVSVPSEGGPPGGRFTGTWSGKALLPGEKQTEYWAKANACTSAPEIKTLSHSLHWKHACPAGLAVERYLVNDNGHAWPGGKPGSKRADTPSQYMDATDMIWTFFSNQTRRQ